jgi:sialic acid synthase SpsE
MKFQSKTTVSLYRCAMIEIVFFDTISDFAKFIAPCRANNSTNQTLLHTSSHYCDEDVCMVGLVDLRARHSAKIQAKKGYFTS